MTKQFGLMLAAAFAAGTLLPGCALFEPKAATPAVEPMTANERDAGGLKVAKEYMDNFTAAFRDKDIEKFKSVISEDRRKKLTPEIFNEILAAQKREQGDLVDMHDRSPYPWSSVMKITKFGFLITTLRFTVC